MRGDYSTFGPTIRAARKEAGITQRDLARAVGIDYTYVSKIEHGAMAPPSEETIRRIARCLLLDPDDLIRRSGKAPSDLINYLLAGSGERIGKLRRDAQACLRRQRLESE